MPTYQTSQQRPDSLWFGGAKIEVSDDGGSTYTDIGLARGLSITENVSTSDIQAQNGVVNEKVVTTHTMNVNFEIMEINLSNLNLLRGGFDTFTTVAGTIVSGATQTVASGWAENDFVSIDNQNYDGSAITVNSVTGSTSGLLTEGTDYEVGKNESGVYGIFLLLTAVDETLTIDYDYTPAASEKLSTGGKSQINARQFRFTNLKIVDGVNKYRYVTIYSAKIASGISLAMANDADDDPTSVIPVEFLAELDTDRTAGDQLYVFENQIV